MPEARPQIRLLIVDDDLCMRDALTRHFEQLGMRVEAVTEPAEAVRCVSQSRIDVALLDLHLREQCGIALLTDLKALQPDIEVIMMTAHGSIETAVEAMKRGASDYLTKPPHWTEWEIRVQKAYEKVQLARRGRQWSESQRVKSPRHRLIGNSPAMQKVRHLIEKVAPTDATVLITGPTGTGKEVIARSIHALSRRSDRPMISFNCAALTETLLESELFGHEKGAFTGAVTAKPGLIELAESGTLFIDEVAEMAPSLQAKLLRVLEDGHYRRVGGTTESHADVRLLAATNKRLEDEVKAHRFREDLFYRLNVLTLELPPLRDRREDIPLLVTHFLATRLVGGRQAEITSEALDLLVRYDWPGNVRELANVLERAQILSEDQRITPDDLPDALVGSVNGLCCGSAEESQHLACVEREHVRAVMLQEKGNKLQAARVLGISRRALYRLLEKHRIEVPPRTLN